MKKICFIASMALLLGACSTTTKIDPNWRPDMTSADFGRYPANYPQIIKKWGDSHFDDAKAVTYLSMSSPREEYIVKNAENKDIVYGYSVCVNLGGIKSEGYYKPFQKHWFFIRNDKVIEERNLEYSYNRLIYRDHKINCDDAE